MCAIIGSFNTEKFKKLINLNSYRGQYSHSICYFSLEQEDIFYLNRAYGPIDLDTIEIPENHYGIAHVQAPTGEKEESDNIHPAQLGDQYLWHNGILKPETIKKLQEEFFGKWKNTFWDTQLLLEYLDKYNIPSDINGSFACLWIKQPPSIDFRNFRKSIFIFRNEIAPLWFDSELNISSTRTTGLSQLPANVVYELQLDIKEIPPRATFETVCNPYLMENEIF